MKHKRPYGTPLRVKLNRISHVEMKMGYSCPYFIVCAHANTCIHNNPRAEIRSLSFPFFISFICLSKA